MGWVLGTLYVQCGHYTPQSDIKSKVYKHLYIEVSGHVGLVEMCGLAVECPGDGGDWCSSGGAGEVHTVPLSQHDISTDSTGCIGSSCKRQQWNAAVAS